MFNIHDPRFVSKVIYATLYFKNKAEPSKKDINNIKTKLAKNLIGNKGKASFNIIKKDIETMDRRAFENLIQWSQQELETVI